MKLELKTENENNANSFSKIFRNVFFIAITIIFVDVALKFGIISRHYYIDLNCRLLSIEKSTSGFKKLSKLTKLKSKQGIWELCRDFVK